MIRNRIAKFNFALPPAGGGERFHKAFEPPVEFNVGYLESCNCDKLRFHFFFLSIFNEGYDFVGID